MDWAMHLSCRFCRGWLRACCSGCSSSWLFWSQDHMSHIRGFIFQLVDVWNIHRSCAPVIAEEIPSQELPVRSLHGALLLPLLCLVPRASGVERTPVRWILRANDCCQSTSSPRNGCFEQPTWSNTTFYKWFWTRQRGDASSVENQETGGRCLMYFRIAPSNCENFYLSFTFHYTAFRQKSHSIGVLCNFQCLFEKFENYNSYLCSCVMQKCCCLV